jgi:signal transduction histidine kinase
MMANHERGRRIVTGRQASSGYDAGLAADVLRQQQIHLLRRVPSIASTSAFVGLMVVIAFWGHTSSLILLGWYATVLATSGVQLLGWCKLSPSCLPIEDSGRRLEHARLWAAVTGALWSSTAYLFFMPSAVATHSVPLQYFLAMVIAGMAAGTVAMLSPIPRVNFWFLFTLLAPVSFRFATEWDRLSLVVFGLCGMLGVTLMHGSWESYSALVELVRSHRRLEKARTDLEDAIESTNDAFALFDEDHRLVTANSRFRDWFSGARRVNGGHAKGQLRQLDGGRWVVSTLRPTSRGGWVSVHVDVSALKQREEELIAAKQRAEEADRAKTQFLANMSHELRTPLNAIIGFSQMFRDQVFGSLGDARYRTYAEDIHDSGRHLLSIINDILDIAKIERLGASELELEPVDLREAAEWCVGLCRGRSGGAGREAVVDIDEEAAWLNVDRRALNQILINLLWNAFKFTPAGKRVGLRARLSEEGGVDVAVWDEGIGISPDKIEEVRKPFVQVESSLAKRYDGAGLGLAIVESLARAHGAELRIESVEGEGSTFTVSFPLERVARMAGAITDANTEARRLS